MSLKFEKKLVTERISKKQEFVLFSLKNKSLQQKVKLLILRDLWNIDWQVKIGRKKIEIVPPETYDKETIKQAMSNKREEIINAHRKWIDENIDFARKNLANGYDVLSSEIDPMIEVCETKRQHALFRIFRYYWSSPYSDYVGRRIKLLIRDKGLPNKPIIGIAALGSPIIHIPERDDFIGWDKDIRTKNLIYAMDAYVIGAVPPYNHLLGGKLISYLLASNEVRKIYREKYKERITLIDKRVSNSLVGIFTTSLYGKSSQYNRLKYKDKLLYQEIGYTKGYGTLHLSDETIQAMVKLLKSRNVNVNHNFGDGPSWVMRIIRTTGDMLGIDSDFLLKHSFKRSIYFVPLAKNYSEVFNGVCKRPKYLNYSKKELIEHWKTRWLKNRKSNVDVITKVLEFDPKDFEV
ncbi:MAG TPA: Druantia anti-phage system protein DruA [Puia sp.]|nr:Druantia anti-phage system protein DruA [Puia sp.]